MGVLSAWHSARAGEAWSAPARLFLLTGVLGGFTTFSAFSLDAAALWERGEPGLAAAYVGASVLGSLVGVAAGLALARAV
jgi:CrcB protein